MEPEVDEFLKFLQKKQKKLAKKLDRIKKKQIEVKASNKEIKDEEKKLIESAPQTEETMLETEKLIVQYQKHLETRPKEPKKPVAKPDDNRISEVLQLWALGEFLKNPEVKEKFVKDNPNEDDLEPFLLFHSNVNGQAGEKFCEISSNFAKSIESYLAKSEKIAQGTMRTYKKLYEFCQKGFGWGAAKVKPEAVLKKEAEIEYSPAVVAKKIEEVKAEPIYNPAYTSKWANEVEEDIVEKPKAKAAVQNEDDGFVVVTGKKPKGQKEKHEGEFRPRGRGRGRGRGNKDDRNVRNT